MLIKKFFGIAIIIFTGVILNAVFFSAPPESLYEALKLFGAGTLLAVSITGYLCCLYAKHLIEKALRPLQTQVKNIKTDLQKKPWWQNGDQREESKPLWATDLEMKEESNNYENTKPCSFCCAKLPAEWLHNCPFCEHPAFPTVLKAATSQIPSEILETKKTKKEECSECGNLISSTTRKCPHCFKKTDN